MPFPSFLNPNEFDPGNSLSQGPHGLSNYSGVNFIYIAGTQTKLAVGSLGAAVTYAKPFAHTNIESLRWYSFTCPANEVIRTFLTTYPAISDSLDLFRPSGSKGWPADVRLERRLATGPFTTRTDGVITTGDCLMPSYFYVGGYDFEPLQYYCHALDLSNLVLYNIVERKRLEQVRVTLVEMARTYLALSKPACQLSLTRYQMLLGDL